jgi:AraC family transcriptional regulator
MKPKKPETRSFYEQAVQGVITHVVTHLDEALDLETLASGACLSPFHFHRVFRGMVGETPVELVRRLRMERAAWRLTHSACSVTEIAFDAGFDTHESFSRAFRAAYSTSPSGFRQRKHPRIELAASCGVHYDADGRAPAFNPRETGGEAMDVEIKHMPELRVGSVHHVGPYNQITSAFEGLGSIVGPTGLLGEPDVKMLAIYHDDPESTPQDQLQSDAGVSVPESVPLPNGLDEQRVPAGRYASTLHVGPYETLGDTWSRFMGEWLPSSGKRLADGVSYEVYENNPTTTPKEQLRTALYIPVAD